MGAARHSSSSTIPSRSDMTSVSVRVVSVSTVKPPPRQQRERIPLTTWDASMLFANYIQKGLLFAPPAATSTLPSTAHLVRHLAAALADTLAAYHPVAGRFVTDQHRDERGHVVGCSVSIDSHGQGVEFIHAVADGVAVADLVPPGELDVPVLVQSFFPLDDALNCDGHHLPLFVAQVTELTDGVLLGFAYNHALSDGTGLWNFLNAWAETARARLTGHPLRLRPPLLQRWSADGGPAAPVVLPCADLSELAERLAPPPLRERMLHFSAESLDALKARARDELLAAGDAAGAAGVTRFQVLAALLWRCVTRATAPEHQTTVCCLAINNRARLQPPLPHEYFGNAVYAISTGAVLTSELLVRGPGWAAATVGRTVAAHTDADIRARVAAWKEKPAIYTLSFFAPPGGLVIGSSPRFDMYGCDFGWGKPQAVRSGKANKFGATVSLYPGRVGEGSIDAEVVLTPEQMTAIDKDNELWAAVSQPPCSS